MDVSIEVSAEEIEPTDVAGRKLKATEDQIRSQPYAHTVKEFVLIGGKPGYAVAGSRLLRGSGNLWQLIVVAHFDGFGCARRV